MNRTSDERTCGAVYTHALRSTKQSSWAFVFGYSNANSNKNEM